MKKRSVTENIFFNMLYQVLVTVLPILTTPYVARTLGLHSNGIHSFTESIVTYFIIFGAIGTSLYGIRKIAYVSVDEEALSKTTKEILFLRILLTLFTLAVYIPLLCIKGPYVILYRIHVINIISNGLDVTWFYQGVEDFKKVTLRNLLVKFLFVISLFLFIKKPDDLPIYVLLTVISSLAGNLVMLFYLPHYVDLKKGKCARISQHLKPSLVLFLPQAMNYIYVLIDRTMLGWMINTDNVGLYDQAQRIVRMVTGILQSVGYVLMARVANLTVKGDEEGIKTYAHKSINFNLFIAFPAMFGILGVADDFIPFFLGNEYLGSAPILKSLSVLLLLTSMNSLMGIQFLVPLGKDKAYTAATTSGAVTSVVLNLLLIPVLGVFGSAIACVVAELVVFVISYWHLRDLIRLREVLRNNYKILLGAVAMYGVVRLISLLSVNTVLKLLLELLGGAAVYFLIAFLTKNETFFMLFAKVKAFVGKVFHQNRIGE